MLLRRPEGKVQGMRRTMRRIFRRISVVCGVVVLAVPAVAEAPVKAVAGYERYISGAEARLAGQHRSDLGLWLGWIRAQG